MSDDQTLWKTRDVAAWFGVEMSTVLDWVERGWIPCFRLGGRKGGRLRFVPAEVEQALQSWRVGLSSERHSNGPATQQRPGPGTRRLSPDAHRTLRPVRD